MGAVCGRYVSAGDLADLSVLLGANPFAPDQQPGTPDEGAATEQDERLRRARERRHGLAPTDPVPAVLPGSEPGSRQLDLLTWGLVPPWADPRSGAQRINARVETVTEKPSFRRAVRTRRALLPADGWYEWRRGTDGTKQPHLVRPPDGALLVFAGIAERARDREGRSLRTCSILTGPAPEPLAWLHDRAPLLVPPALWTAWLDADADVDALLEAVRSTPPPPLVVHPVSRAVNATRNTGPQLTEPLAAAVQDSLW